MRVLNAIELRRLCLCSLQFHRRVFIIFFNRFAQLGRFSIRKRIVSAAADGDINYDNGKPIKAETLTITDNRRKTGISIVFPTNDRRKEYTTTRRRLRLRNAVIFSFVPIGVFGGRAH